MESEAEVKSHAFDALHLVVMLSGGRGKLFLMREKYPVGS